MTGKLEPTNSPYKAKLSAIEIGDAISKELGHNIKNLMPTNLYGPNDHFSANDSHVIPGLIFRMHEAKKNKDSSFKIWGSGKPLREFLYVDDLATAINTIIKENPVENIIIVGSWEVVCINDLATLIKTTINYEGSLEFDSSMPDGNPRKLLDSTTMKNLGWKPKIHLEEGLNITYNWFLKKG